jgi:hypothetical protein
MSTAPVADGGSLEQLARRFEVAAEQFRGVAAIVFWRPDKLRAEFEREARRIFVPSPDPLVVEYEAEFEKRKGADGKLKMDDEFLSLLKDRFANVDPNADRLRRADGERKAIQVATDWEKWIPPNGRLVRDATGQPYRSYSVREFRDGATQWLWQFELVGPPVPHRPILAADQFEILAFHALELIPAALRRGNSPVSTWLIHLADREEPLRPSAWEKPTGFVRDQRRVLDYAPDFSGILLWGRSASQPDKNGGRKIHEWWAARLDNVFWLSALAVRSSTEIFHANDPTGATDEIAVDWAGLLTSPPLSARQIAEIIREPLANVERVLRYRRRVQPFCFVQDDSPKKGEAEFLHKMPEVLPALKHWLEKRHRKRNNS